MMLNAETAESESGNSESAILVCVDRSLGSRIESRKRE